MRQKHIILILSIIFVNLLGKTWRNFPKYYKSLTYVSIVNSLYYFLCKRHLVWEFIPLGIDWKFLRTVHTIIVTPLIVLLFLSNFPKTFLKQMIYIIKWVLGAILVEFVVHKLKLIQYKHGWNIFWSALLYLKMFVYSHLFTKKPLMTWFLSLCSCTFFIIKFKVPIKKKHVFSRNFGTWVDYFYHSPLEDLF